ncbi:nuclear transport factor 2 family protein [Streptomyces sp. M2CJ-2]|uniref:nuclear transport factor 2 family protein n=1 Tax=Streptomyces sp. M2CJ-2 TaxID=2803948 RepID=UPI0019255849|nr:nuclear transport factor 2 family protein [Streptomyces sp. M2CJ-2]MBL3670626.1 nuclear transport factor 2 family protein [Streptomyces sp. M2CJ-2]
MNNRTIAVGALLLAVALTGCSSSDNGEASNKPTPAASSSASTPAAEEPKQDIDEAALEEAVRNYTRALFSGDESGYDTLSARCKKQMTKASWVGMAEGAHQQYGAQKVTDLKVDQLSGDLARVSYGAGNIPQFDRESQSWAREGGTWRWDACPSTG